MKLLIIEDGEAKMSSIRSVLEEVYPLADVYASVSVSSAIELVKMHEFDLVIADMALPTYDITTRETGGSARTFGGIEVFDALEREGRVTPVIVVTSYPVLVDGDQSLGLSQLSEKLENDYPDLFSGTVYFDSSLSGWEMNLKHCLGRAMGAVADDG